MFETPAYLPFLLPVLEQSLRSEIIRILPSERMSSIEERREQKEASAIVLANLQLSV
jgi:hypothetical protein